MCMSRPESWLIGKSFQHETCHSCGGQILRDSRGQSLRDDHVRSAGRSDAMDIEVRDSINLRRRRFLIAGTTVVSGAVVVSAIVPFVESMNPSAAAKAAGAPIDVDVSKLDPGQLLTLLWRSRPAWVLHRTPAQLSTLPELDPLRKDPESRKAQQFRICQGQ